MYKNIIFLLLFIPCLSSFESIKPIEDFSHMMISSDLVVIATVTDLCLRESDKFELAELHTVQALKGRPSSTFFVEISKNFLKDNIQMSTKDLGLRLDGEYLLFLQKKSDSGYSTLNQSQFVFEQVEVGGQQMFKQANKLFDHEKFLLALESFLYNEVEILESEFTLTE